MATQIQHRPPGICLVTAALEALVGRRPLHQIRPRLGHQAFVNLAQCAETGSFRDSAVDGMRVQMPSARALEVTTRIQQGQRWLACTLRLELRRQWTCTDLQVLGITT